MEIQEFLQKFENGKYKIRVVYLDGEWLFFGIDAAKSLGYKDPKSAIRQHVDDEDKKTLDLNRVAFDHPISDAIYQSGWLAPVITLINESGLYSLILRSNLSEAKKFKRWITSEVLPAIRKYGYYINPAVAAPNVQNAAPFSEFTKRETVEILLKLLPQASTPALKNQIIKQILLNLSPEFEKFLEKLNTELAD